MDGLIPITPDDLDRELAGALRVQPSSEFRAHVRARVSHEAMATAWHLRMPVTAYAGLAGLLAAGAIWLSMSASSPVTDARLERAPAGAAPVSGAVATVPPPALEGVANEKQMTRLMSGSRRPVTRPREILQPATGPADRQPEVLLSESELAGTRLLFESAASGRLELPEEMLHETSVPIAQERPGTIPSIEPRSIDNADRSEGDRQ